jgi:hypothetical protein
MHTINLKPPNLTIIRGTLTVAEPSAQVKRRNLRRLEAVQVDMKQRALRSGRILVLEHKRRRRHGVAVAEPAGGLDQPARKLGLASTDSPVCGGERGVSDIVARRGWCREFEKRKKKKKKKKKKKGNALGSLPF